MTNDVFPPGSRVQVISYGPFRSLKGTVRAVDTIAADLEDPCCFYLIALDRAHVKEPIWFQYDEVELVAAARVTPHCLTEHLPLLPDGCLPVDRFQEKEVNPFEVFL